MNKRISAVDLFGVFRFVFLSALIAGCGAKLVPTPGPEEASDTLVNEDEEIAPNFIQTSDNEDGTYQTIVDAKSHDFWVLFAFNTSDEVGVDDLTDSIDWDLGFKRYNIIANGGISGPGETGVAALMDEDFDSVERAPDVEYLFDAEDSDDEDQDPDYGFLQAGTWYNYNPFDHTLSPKEIVYVIKTTTGQYFKVSIEDYYDEAGDSGVVTFKWAKVDGPQ